MSTLQSLRKTIHKHYQWSPIFITISLQPDGRTEVCWKCNCRPFVYVERNQSSFLKVRNPEISHQCFCKCVLKLNTKSFSYRGYVISCDCHTQIIGSTEVAAPHGFSEDPLGWASQSQEEKEVFPKLNSLLYFRYLLQSEMKWTPDVAVKQGSKIRFWQQKVRRDESHHRKFQHCCRNCLLWLLQTELWRLSQHLSSCLSAQLCPEVVAVKRHGRNWAPVTDRPFGEVSHSHQTLASPLHVLAERTSSTHQPWCGLLSQTPTWQLAAPRSSPGNLFGKAHRDTGTEQQLLTAWPSDSQLRQAE